MIPNRRRFLAAAGAVTLGFSCRAIDSCSSPLVVSQPWSPASLLPSLFKAGELGEKYLSRHPSERDRAFLLGELTAAGSVTNSEAFRRHFSRLRSEEFQQDRVVLVDGWVLARSEARLCALLAIA